MLASFIERIGLRLSTIHVDHKRILRSALLVSIFVMIGKLAGAFKEIAIAYRYGISPTVDAYQLTLTMVTWIPGTVATVLGVVLVPALVKLQRLPIVERTVFLGELQGISVVGGTAIATLLYTTWGPALRMLDPHLSPVTLELSLSMARGMSFIAIFTLFICISAARLQACEKHVNTLLECVPAAVLLLWILAASAGNSIPLTWGTTIGFALQAALLSFFAKRADGIRAGLRFSLRSPQWPSMYRAVGVFVVGQLVMSFVTPLDQYFVSGLGSGAIATLGYANRLLGLVLGIGALAISRAILPVLSGILNGAHPERARSMAFKWSMAMFIGGCAVMLVGWCCANLGVKLMFERGAFTAEDTISVSHLLRWGLVQLPPYFSVLVLVQLFAGEGRFREMAAIAVGNFFVKAVSDYFLIGMMGLSGVLLATALMHAASLVGYVMLARRRS